MQTRRKLKAEENDSKGSSGEKMTEEEKSRTDSLWKSFLSDTAGSSKTQDSSKSTDKPANVSLEQKTAEKDEGCSETKIENTSPRKSEADKLLDDDEKTIQSINAETESTKSVVDNTPTTLKTEDSNDVSIGESESENSSSCQNSETTEDLNCSKDNVKLDTSNSDSTSDDTTKTNPKFSLLKPDKSKGLSSPLAGLGSRKRGISSISNILNSTSKVSKLSTLEKSKRDWNQFKDEHKLEEELSTFNRGKNGYLEKQDFLQRTDLRQFEMEKELRSVGRRKF